MPFEQNTDMAFWRLFHCLQPVNNEHAKLASIQTVSNKMAILYIIGAILSEERFTCLVSEINVYGRISCMVNVLIFRTVFLFLFKLAQEKKCD